MLTSLLLTPLVISLLCFACRWLGDGQHRAVTLLHTSGITLLLAVSLLTVATALNEGEIFSLCAGCILIV